MLVNC
jgi:hypothetical protein